jgi:hypothetical protein
MSASYAERLSEYPNKVCFSCLAEGALSLLTVHCAYDVHACR